MLRPPEARALPALGLVALVLFLFRSVVFGGRVFYEWDIHLLWHTYARVFARTLAAGSWPLWNPWSAFGVPLLADANAQVLYPTTWLSAFFSPVALHGPLVAAHALLGAFGAYRLFRRLDVSDAAAAFGAACWTLSGPLLSLVYVFNMLAAAAWLPWVLLAALHAVEAPSLRRAVAWGAALAIQLFAGSPDLSLFTGLLCVLVVLRQVASADARARPGILVVSLGAAAALLGLGALQWAPSLELARSSGRWAQGAAGASYWSLHPVAALEAALPVTLWRLPLTGAWSAALFESRVPFLRSHYLGLGTLVFAALGAIHPGPWRRPASVVAVVALVFALGAHTPVEGALVRVLPVLGLLRFPEKALVVVALAVSYLAAAGFDRLREAGARRADLAIAVCATGAACALLGSLVLRSWPWTILLGPALAGESLRPLAMAAGLAAAAAGFVAIAAESRRRATLALAAAASLATLGIAQQALNPTAPPELLTLRPAPLDDLGRLDDARLWSFDYFDGDRAQRYLGRSDFLQIATLPRGLTADETAALATRNMLYPPSAAAFGVRGSYDADFSQSYPRPLGELTDLFRQSEREPGALRLLQMGGVTHVIAFHDASSVGLEPVASEPGFLPEPLRVYRVPASLPRVRIVARARDVADASLAGALLDPAFDPAREVLLQGIALSEAPDTAPGTARIVEERPDRLRIEIDAPGAGWLVQSETWDPGWHATLDGAPVPILRANLAFRALSVPAGRHMIEERYRPASVRYGALVSGLAWAAALVVALRPARRSTRSAGEAGA